MQKDKGLRFIMTLPCSTSKAPPAATVDAAYTGLNSAKDMLDTIKPASGLPDA